MFNGIFDSELTPVISVGDFLLCLGFALALGLLTACCYAVRTRHTKSFLLTLALLPAVVCVVILLVNGNIGTGVAVAGAFSLVRFRSVPGTAKEICALFLAVGIGLITGMGYLGLGVLFTVILCGAMLLYTLLGFGNDRKDLRERILSITVPEDLNYTDMFNDIFATYTTSSQLQRVKTTNMGSLFRLTYRITLRNPSSEKEMIDKLRQRNGNLEISVSVQDTPEAQL